MLVLLDVLPSLPCTVANFPVVLNVALRRSNLEGVKAGEALHTLLLLHILAKHSER